jgi:hypothetical protein
MMHEMFPDWIRVLTVDGDLAGTPWELWSTAVDEFVDTADAEDVVQLVRCAFGQNTSDWEEAWRGALRKHDSSFPLREQDKLVSLLAGTAVIMVRESEPSALSAVALYASICAARRGWNPVLPDVTVSPEDLRELAQRVRVPPSWKPSRVTVTPASYEDSLPDEDSVVDAAGVTAVAHALAKGTSEALDRVQAAMARVTEQREEPLREQVAVLQWLLAGHSHLVGRAWSAIPACSAVVAAAVELHQLTRFNIGLPDAPAMLAQILELSGSGDEQVVPVPTQATLEDLTPLSAAIADGSLPRETYGQLGVGIYDELTLTAAYTEAVG